MVELLVVIIIISVLVAIALPRYFAAIYAGRVRACQANTKIVNTAVQAYFAQNKAWPADVSDMLPPEATNPVPTTPAGQIGGQLTEMPICPFEVAPGNLKPYNLVALYATPGDSSTPQVGVVVNYDNHFADAQWQSAAEHLP